jgi:hypothetical protein
VGPEFDGNVTFGATSVVTYQAGSQIIYAGPSITYTANTIETIDPGITYLIQGISPGLVTFPIMTFVTNAGGTSSTVTVGPQVTWVWADTPVNITSNSTWTVSAGQVWTITGGSASSVDLSGMPTVLLPATVTVGGIPIPTSPKPTATVATTTALPANTYNNGTAGKNATITITATGVLTVDGRTTALNDVILVNNEATQANNGLYKVTTAGAVGVQAVLTRSTSMDVTGKYVGGATDVILGTVNKATRWLFNSATEPTVGSTSIVFEQVSGGSGSGVTGSGTTNQIPKFTGSSAVGDSLLSQPDAQTIQQTVVGPGLHCVQHAQTAATGPGNLSNGNTVLDILMDAYCGGLYQTVAEILTTYTGNGTTRHGKMQVVLGGSQMLALDDVAGLGVFGATPAVQQTIGSTLTNNVTSGGTGFQIDDITSLTVYATDAANIRNDIYQLAKALKLVIDLLRAYGLGT